MLLKPPCLPLLFSAFLFSSTATFAQSSLTTQDSTYEEDNSMFYSMSLLGGYQHAYVDLSNLNGGVPMTTTFDDNGVALGIDLTFQPEIFNSTRFYVDAMTLTTDERQWVIPSIGLRYDFFNSAESFQPYVKAGLGYAFLAWDDSPVSNVIAERPDSSSVNVSAQLGFDYYLTSHLALGAAVRVDSYDIGTQVVGHNQVTTIQDDASLSTLLSLTYRFGGSRISHSNEPVPIENVALQHDDDKDGVFNQKDLCPSTLQHVPVSTNGCPLDVFELDLTFEFGLYRVANITNTPPFSFTEFMRKNPDYQVLIVGYTDSKGTESFNQHLSDQRANEGRNFLLEQGIEEQRITIAGKGEQSPEYNNDTEHNQALNRRIGVVFYKPTKVN